MQLCYLNSFALLFLTATYLFFMNDCKVLSLINNAEMFNIFSHLQMYLWSWLKSRAYCWDKYSHELSFDLCRILSDFSSFTSSVLEVLYTSQKNAQHLIWRKATENNLNVWLTIARFVIFLTNSLLQKLSNRT